MSSVIDRDRRRSPAELSRARQDAGRMRAQWLLGLADGKATLYELLIAATRDGGHPLRALRLHMAIEHLPGISRSRTDAIIAELRYATGVPDEVPNRELNVAWLLDARQPAGRRLTALATALLRQTEGLEAVTVGGFPYGPLGGTEEVL